MKQVTLRYYEEGAEPFGLTVTLPKSWLTKPPSKLVAHFFKAYATEFPGAPRGDVDRYEFVDVGSGLEVGAGTLGTAVADGAVLSVVAKRRAAVDLTADGAAAAPLSATDAAAAADDDDRASSSSSTVAAGDAPPASVAVAAAKKPAASLSAADCEHLDEDEFEQYCVYMFDQHYRNNKFMSYFRVRKQLRAQLRKRLEAGRGSDDDDRTSSSSAG